MKKFSFLLALLFIAGTAYGQGTQISGSQLKDGAITNAKVNASAAISYSKINFTDAPASLINAENPLTFNTPLSRSGNTISITIIPVTSGGIGLTSVTAGRLLFGGNSTTLGTSANLAFDSGTNAFTVTGSGSFTTTLNVGGATTFNGKAYTWPVAYGSAGAVLTDAAGDGALSWAVPADTGVTLQGSDPPGTLDTGGINISGKGFFGGSVQMQGNEIFFNTSPLDFNDYVKWDSGTDRMRMLGYAGADIGASLIGPALTVKLVPGSAAQVITTSANFSALTSGNLTASPLAVAAAPTVTNEGTPGATTYVYQVRALLADGTGVLGAPQSTATSNATLDNTNYNKIVWTAVPNAVAYDVFRPTAGGTPGTTGKITASPVYALELSDTGLVGAGGADPVDNTGVVKGKYLASTLGANVTTGVTVFTTGGIFHITDAATPIQYLIPPTGFIGSVVIIPDAAFTTVDTGNIYIASTAVIGKALIMTYDGTKWSPSY